MDIPPKQIGPVTKAALRHQEGKPPDIIMEWDQFLKAPGDFIFLWAAQTRTKNSKVGWMHFGTHVEPGLTVPDPVKTTAPEKIERLLSPLAHEGRVRIMQALYGESLSSSDLAAATGFQGGGLYHHLRELKYAAYIRDADGRYSLTELGHQLLITMALIARQTIADRGEEGLAAASPWQKGKQSRQ